MLCNYRLLHCFEEKPISVFKYITIVFLLTFAKYGAKAQQPGTRHLTDRDGLPSSTVYHFLQSKKGYLFVGTAAGLVKYNGFHFELISNPLAKASDASQLQEDEDGNIWFSNFNHELFVYRITGKIEKIAAVNEKNFNPSGRYFLGQNGDLWFTDNYNIYLLNCKTFEVRNMAFSDEFRRCFSPCGANCVYSEQKGKGTIYQKGASGLEPIENILRNPAKNENQRGFIFSQKRRMIASFEALSLNGHPDFSLLQSESLKKLKIFNNYGMLNDGSMWVCATNGVLFFDKNGEPLYRGDIILEGKNTSYVTSDKEGNIWIGTLNDGLFMIDNFFVRSYVFYNENHGINGVSALFKVGGELYASTTAGDIHVFSPSGNRIWKTGMHRDVYFMMPLNQGKFLLNSSVLGATSNFPVFVPSFGSLKSWMDAGNKVVLSNQLGVYLNGQKMRDGKFSPILGYAYTYTEIDENGKFLSTEKKVDSMGYLLEGRSGRLYKDQEGRIWISSTTGIYYYRNDSLFRIRAKNMPNAMAMDFAADNRGKVYMIIANSGIFQYENRRLSLFVSKSNGLLGNTGRRLIWHDNVLWMASAMGLNAVEINNRKVYSFRTTDGMPSNDILDIEIYGNYLWCATNSGLGSVPLKYRPDNPGIPLMYLLGIKVNGKPYHSEAKEYDLKYFQNSLEIFFNGINFKSRELLSYEYRLLGLGENWMRIGGENASLNFLGLSPGRYQFQIRAINDKGYASGIVESKWIEIHRPWWLRWWFLILVFMVFGTTVYLLMRYRSRVNQRKSELEHDLRMSQLTSLKAQMNPHFMFNALNSIQDFILQNDRVSANTFLGKFSDLMRMVLEMSNKPFITLENELKALQLYLELEAIRFEDTLTYNIVTSDNLDYTEWELPSMIIQPFVENALKHGLLHKRNHRELKVSFSRDAHSSILKVQVEDNGVGRQEAERLKSNRMKKHASFATGATDQRLRLLNLDSKKRVHMQYIDLKDSSGNPSGTRVELEIQMTAIIQ